MKRSTWRLLRKLSIDCQIDACHPFGLFALLSRFLSPLFPVQLRLDPLLVPLGSRIGPAHVTQQTEHAACE